MPFSKSLHDALVRRYGQGKGSMIHWSMIGEGKGPYGPGGKYHDEHLDWAARVGVPANEKPPAPKRRGARRG
jgi:hypothetical protein